MKTPLSLITTLVAILTLLSLETSEAAPLFTGVAVSTDAGATLGQANTSHNVAADLQGRIFVGFGTTALGVRVAASTDRGQSFTSNVQVSADNAVGNVDLAVAADGTVYVVWMTDTTFFLSKSIDRGLTWSAPNPIDTIGSSDGVHVAVLGTDVYVRPDGNTNVFYHNGNGGVGAFTSATTYAGIFSHPLVDPGSGEVFDLSDDPTVRLFQSTDHGASFSPVTLDNSATVYYSDVAGSFGPLGRFGFIAGGSLADPTIGYRIDLTTGAVVQLVMGADTDRQGRSLAADADGNVVDSYYDSGTIKFRASRNLGAAFAPAVNVADAFTANAAINLVFHDIVVAYQTDTGIFLNVYSGEFLSVTVIAATGQATPPRVKGDPSPGNYRFFGPPSINDAGQLAFLTTLSPTNPAIVAGMPPQLVVQRGDPAPGTVGTFAAFRDPLLDAAGHVAFLGYTGASHVRGVLGFTNPGIWTTAGDGTLQLVVAEGDAATGIEGMHFTAFQQVAFENETIVFAATVGGKHPATTAVYRWTPESTKKVKASATLEPLVFGGETVMVGAASKTVRSIKALGIVGGSPGHGRSFHVTTFAALLLFTDGTTALAHYADAGPLEVDVPSDAPFAFESESGFFSDSLWQKLGVPCFSMGAVTVPPPTAPFSVVSRDGLATTASLTYRGDFLATMGKNLVGATLEPGKAVFVHSTGASRPPNAAPSVNTGEIAVVRSGDPVPGLNGTTFKSFSDPVSATQGSVLQVAGLAKITGNENLRTRSTGSPVTASHDQIIFQSPATPGNSHVVAREGAAAPGVEGGFFQRFISVALPAWENAGPLFVAQLKAGKGGVNASNDRGLWSSTGNGAATLALREGDALTIEGVLKKILSFEVIGLVFDSEGQTRSFNIQHLIAARVSFADRTQAIVTIRVP